MKNIIFDWTGVVKDSVEDHHQVINLMFEDFGVPSISFEDLRDTWKQPYMDFYNTHAPELTMEEQKKAYKKAFAQVPKGKPYPGMPELIKNLHLEGCNMVILSSDSPSSILDEIESFGLEGLFADMVLEVHDKADHVADLMSKNKMDQNNTAIIGDSNNEIKAGKSVGIKTIAVTWGLCSRKNLEEYKPDHLVNNLQELKNILL